MEVKILDQHERNAALFFGVDRAREGTGQCASCLIMVPKKRTAVNAVQITPKQHKQRSNQTAAYHKKVQKRWDKRAKTDPKFQVAGTPVTMVLNTDFKDLFKNV